MCLGPASWSSRVSHCIFLLVNDCKLQLNRLFPVDILTVYNFSSIYYDPWRLPCSVYMPDSLSPSFLWSTSWPGTLSFILHTFLYPIIVFFSQQTHTHSIATCFAVVPTTEIMSSNLSLSFNPLLGTLSCSLMQHICLTVLISTC